MIQHGALERYGPLTEAIQVKGAIALDRLKHLGMAMDQERLASARLQHQHRLKTLVTEISNIAGCEKLFRRDRYGEIILTDSGRVPSLSQNELKRLLEDSAGTAAEVAGQDFPIPQTAKGNISLKAEDWGKIAPFVPFVSTWIEWCKTTKAIQAFGNLEGDVVHPNYTTMVRTGRTSCSSPNIQNLPRSGGFREAFVPRPGYVFLILDYSYIELRTLAAVCRARYGRSTLADVIRAGVDPHCHTAAMIAGLDLGGFMALKTSDASVDCERFARLRQQAKVINFGIPGGLGASALVAYAWSTYGVRMTLEEAAEFRRRLIEEVYPELGLYLADEGMDALARNLNATVADCWARFDREGTRSGAVVGGLRNVVRGKTRRADGRHYTPRYLKGVWDGLIRLNRVGELKPLLARRQGSEALFRRLFHSAVTTPTGRVRGRVGYAQARNTPFQGLAADGAKLALWDLVHANHRVVAFIHDEVVIELPEDADHAAEAARIQEIMNRAMEQVTGGVPVDSEYALARRWSKKARLIQDAAGRLLPWDEDVKP